MIIMLVYRDVAPIAVSVDEVSEVGTGGRGLSM
jgi:hypothetical protein